jgi:hypothetical protein
MAMDRRTALTHLLTAGAGALVGFSAAKANAGKPHVAPGPGKRWPTTSVSVSIEDPYGRPFNDYWHGGSRYLAGELGERYVIRLTNNSAARVEAVVTVDGRDVVSGEVGNYAKHRGYVIDRWGSVTIDGFRQSMSQVASFRFGGVSESYSARMGTPQNVGVIGVAVFDERPPPRPRPRPRPLAPPPRRDYRDDYDWWGADESAAPFPGSANKKQKRGGRSRGSASAESAPSADRSYGGGYGGYSRPAPSPEPHLGTEYGESRHSSAREVTFRRKSKRPDALLTLYYDSLDGLRRRGVPVDPPPPPYYPPYREPEPWPDRRFAPPPPRY